MPRSDENRQKEKAGLSLLICIKMILLGEARLNKLHKLINSLLLVGTTCDDADLGVAHDAEGKHAEKALGGRYTAIQKRRLTLTVISQHFKEV